jgi:hypothetical protein
MNKIIIGITLITIAFTACEQKKETEKEVAPNDITSSYDSTDLVTTELEENTPQEYLIKYKFKKDDSFSYRMTVISQNDQSMETDTLITNSLQQTLTYLFNFKIIDVDADNVSELECTFKSIKLSASANGEEVNYQSGSVTDSLEIVKFAEYESFVNNPFRLRVTNHGEILDIFRADNISNKFLEIRGLIDSLSTEEKLKIKDDLVGNLIRPMMAQIIRELPTEQVAQDSTWSYSKATMPVMVFQIDYTNLYKVEKFEKMDDEVIAVIDGVVDVQVSGEPTYSEQGINYKFEMPISSASGKIYFNVDKGLVQKSKTQTRLETAYTMEMARPQGLQKGSTREVIINRNILELL